MAFTEKDLLDEYSWVHTKKDDPKLTGEPDHNLLNRREGYEVLYMINKIMSARGLTDVASGRKIELMIKVHPGNLRSQKHVADWIKENWDRFK